MKASRNMSVTLSGEGKFWIRFPELQQMTDDTEFDLKRVKSNVRFFEKILRRCGIEYEKQGDVNSNQICLVVNAVKYPVELWAETNNNFGFTIYGEEKEMWKPQIEIWVDDEREINLIKQEKIKK